jgi:polyisoprenoid-binding protein YceI
MVCLTCAALSSQAAERYVINPAESYIGFQAYSWLARPEGRFRALSGDIVADPENLVASSVRLRIEAASIDTGNAKRDAHLRTEDFLFVEQYPTITFTSTAIRPDGPGYVVQGNLQIRGVARLISVPVTVQQQPGRLQIHGSIRLLRKDFGITHNALFNPVNNAVDVAFRIVGVNPE